MKIVSVMTTSSRGGAEYAAISLLDALAARGHETVMLSDQRGVVRDTSGAVLPGVTVEAASPVLIEKVRTTVTDGNGRYQLVDLRLLRRSGPRNRRRLLRLLQRLFLGLRLRRRVPSSVSSHDFLLGEDSSRPPGAPSGAKPRRRA